MTHASPQQDALNLLARRKVCAWCRHPFASIYRGDLCRHCYSIKMKLRSLHRKVEYAKRFGRPHRGHGLISPVLKLDYMIAIQMAEDAQREGRKYGSLHDAEITSLDLAGELNQIGRWFVKGDLYKDEAFWFNSLDVSQRRSVLFALSKLSRAHLRRRRRFRCAWRVAGKEIRQVLKARCPGTYRVEKDPVAFYERVRRGGAKDERSEE